ncbi:MAG: hypothetical protein QE487_06715 [Fluviicola sp.]|nr:hypothetical protein [Fluviicola sp.]
MNTYTIFQLLVFFDTQSHRDFETIKEVLTIIDSKEIKSEKKHGLILNLLRNAALLDIEFIKVMPQSVRESIIEEYIRKSRNHGNKKR